MGRQASVRARVRLVAITAAATTVAAGLTAGAALAGTTTGSTATATATVASTAITLVTGDRVVASTAAPSAYAVQRAQTSGPGTAIHQFRIGSETFVVPAVAQRYLGTTLDPSLFDVSALATAEHGSGRLDVAVAYTGGKPSLPGLTVTSDQAGVATGYLTAASARAFGTALVAQWLADAKAGRPSTTGLFAGITRITATPAAPPVVSPNFPMHTLRVTGIDAAGQAEQFGFGILINVDNFAKYAGFVQLVNGQARVSVPTGNYAAVFDDFTFDEQTNTSTDSTATIPTYLVKGDRQTLTYDMRTSTVRPTVTTPRPLTSTTLGITYDREARVGGGLSFGVGGTDVLTINPMPPVSIGTQTLQVTLSGAGGQGAKAYTYDLAFDHASVGTSLADRATAANVATVTADYFADRPGRIGLFARAALLEGVAFFSGTDLKLGIERTEYVGGTTGLQWVESAAANAESFDDPGFVDGGPYVYAGGTTVNHRWLEPPLGAGIPTPTPTNDFAFCYGCQSANAITLGMAPFTDSMPDHSGELFGNPNGQPVAHFTLTRNGKTIADAADAFGATVSVPAGTATYHAVIDIDRSLVQTRISPVTHTELGFTSTTGQGPAVPSSWFCDAASPSAPSCTVLPVLQARLSLGASLDDTAPTGSVPVAVQVSRAPGAAASPATSATLQFRRAGTSAWTTATLHNAGGDAFRGQLAVPAAWTGQTVDIRVTAADAGGSTFDQTVSSAFGVDKNAVPAAYAAAATAVRTAATGPSAAATDAGAAAPIGTRAACSAEPAGQFRCLSLWRPGAAADRASARASAAALTAPKPTEGYGPADIASAYQLDTSRGAGQTIAIVDAFGDPKVESDLAISRAAWGLPACPRANGCLRVVNQTGGSKLPAGDPGWGVETSLDVQAVSYACPKCRILLVQASSNSLTDIGKAVNEAVKLGADVVSNSYGTDEFTGILAMGNRYYKHPGTAIVASTGDFGFTAAQFPAVLSTTIAVGGTTLKHQGSGWTESAWSGAGSGCSAWVAKPSWQHDGHCQMRTTSDVSAVADPDTGLAVYDTYGLGADNGWIVVGGTSASAPLVSGMIGLAGNGSTLDDASRIYAHPSALHDVVGGSNGFCGGDYLCTGLKGYDGPTGMGSPRGTTAL
jgi:Subtilase family